MGSSSKWFRRLAGRGRVPVVLQMSAADCGAACLAMIASHHGRGTSLHEVTELAGGVGRDGLSARQIAQIARRLGLRARGLSIEDEHLERIELPAIAHWGFNHFVVLEEVSGDRATIVDPGSGRRRMRRAELLESFTGVVLLFEPGVGFVEGKGSARRPWRDYVRYLAAMKGGGRLLLQVLLASLFLQLVGLVLPVLTAVTVDHVIPLRAEGLLPVLGLGIAMLALGQATAHHLRAVLLLHLRGRLDARLMLGFFEHVLRLPYRFFQGRTSGDLLQRLHSNSTLREALTSQTLSALLDGSFVIFSLALLWSQDAPFGAVTTAAGAAQVLILVLTARRVKEETQRHLASQAASHGYLVESLGGMETIKATGAEQRVFDHWSNLFHRQLHVSIARDHLGAMIHSATVGLSFAAPLALLWIGAARVLGGGLSLGAMLALLSVAAGGLAPLSSLVASGQSFQAIGAHLARLADVLETAPEQDESRVVSPGPLAGRIELRDVSFRYAGDGPLVLDHVQLRVAPGTKVALVGPSGSGKSTLARLLLGLYEPTEGEILYDGAPLSDLDYRQVRSQIGVVVQDTYLFSGSIRDNITLTDPAIPLAAVVEAARKAQIADEIEAMPMGYDTLISEGGGSLSGGQRQRIAIARALVRSPRILLFDEATSHLDAITERRVEEALAGLQATRILVAHRLSTVRDADCIVVLRGGRVVETGDHASLLRRGGFYAELMRRADVEPSGSRGDGGREPSRIQIEANTLSS